MPKTFDDLLRKAAGKSEWISWLLHDKGPAARSQYDFLATCFLNIPAAKHDAPARKFNGDKYEIEATLHELVAHELLRRLNLMPEYEPSMGGKTPDLRFKVLEKEFIADVYLAHSPLKTYRDFSNGTGEAWDTAKPGESRAHKVAEELARKANKYKVLSEPLVLFVFLGDHRILNPIYIEQALFGLTIREIHLEGGFPKHINRARIPVGGLLLPDEEGRMRFPNLSAVIVCDWFDTANRQNPGKRLECIVFHNWSWSALPVNAFDSFPQIIWERTDIGIWKPWQTIADGLMVARFTQNGGLELRPYIASAPW